MKSIDPFFHKKYNKDTYNCAHFVVEVWLYLFGIDISRAVFGLLAPVKERRASMSIGRSFRRLEAPETPCVVLMRRLHATPHVGIYLKGRVLHIHETGVEYMPVEIASRGFNRIGFYAC